VQIVAQEFATLIVTRDGRVTTITMNRPDAMNAVDLAMHEEMQAALDDFADDPAQYICVITGAGARAFCAGSDLKAAARRADPVLGHYPAGGYAGLTARRDLAKPGIAAVNGVALGGGFEIALACDIIIAADTAKFGLPEPRVGAIALAGGLHRLARQIGLKPAMAMALMGDIVSAAEGVRLGFVNQAVPAAELSQAVRAVCEKILACAPLAVRASKAAMLRGLGEADVFAALAAQPGYPEVADWRQAEDTREGPRAFAEKRPPQWRAR
jgi:crotonobetainyl-CoA hydratase